MASVKTKFTTQVVKKACASFAAAWAGILKKDGKKGSGFTINFQTITEEEQQKRRNPAYKYFTID